MDKMAQTGGHPCTEGPKIHPWDNITSVNPLVIPSSERIPGMLLPKSQNCNIFPLRKVPVLPQWDKCWWKTGIYSSCRHVNLSLSLMCPLHEELSLLLLQVKEQSRGDMLWISWPFLFSTSSRHLHMGNQSRAWCGLGLSRVQPEKHISWANHVLSLRTLD